MLFDFQLLESMYTNPNTKQTLTIVFFSKNTEGYKLHSDADKSLLEVLSTHMANGDVGEAIYHNGTVLLGIGSTEENVLRTNIKKSMRGLHNFLKKFDNSEIIFAESHFAEDAVYAFIIAGYNYNFLKKKQEYKQYFLNAPKYGKAMKIAFAQNFSRFLGDTPANLMTPTLFSEYAKAFLSKLKNVQVSVFSKDFMQENRMNLLLSVSQGSDEDPQLVHLKYVGNPSKGDAVDLAMVGKGVTFDTGGVSIKPAAGMASMKYDMMGAATLLASFKVIAELGLKINVSATFPLVENTLSGKATKPGDVFVSMKGLSVEVDNTDAEGRLILADALTFAQRGSPRYLIDAATLTGAMVVALGNVYGGFFTNNDDFGKLIYKAGLKTDDLLWRMPLSCYYKDSLKSHAADLNNMGGPGAGSCKAACFLGEFVEKETIWAHFDIAGLMDKSFNSELFGEASTGRPVPAFVEIAEQLAEI